MTGILAFSGGGAGASNNLIMTPGTNVNKVGYQLSVFGNISTSPFLFPDGMTLNGMWSDDTAGNSKLLISGFSVDPTRTYLFSATAGYNTLLQSTASAYGYAAGVATWTWTGSSFQLIATIPVTISIDL